MLSHSERGRLGAAASNQTKQEQKKLRILNYNQNPTKCQHCFVSFSYAERNKKFCNQSCSATYNNLNRGNKSSNNTKYQLSPKTKSHCMNCGDKLRYSKGKFCSKKCTIEHKRNIWIEESEKTGILPSLVKARYYIKNQQGHNCKICNRETWNDKPIPLVLDHINGNSDDWRIDNLRYICCNCDAQTDTYKAKNKGNGRAYRRQRYAENKSY